MTSKSVSRARSRDLSVRDTLFLLSLDLRTSRSEAPDPVQVAAWRLWHRLERAERGALDILEAIHDSPPPPSLALPDVAA